MALLPFMDVDQKSIDTVAGAIEKTYGWNVVVMERQDLPKSAWYKPKKRYRAEILLDWLNTKIPEDADRIMGLTKRDISTTKGDIYDWGICGLAEAPGTASMVSTYRIKKKMGKLTPAERKAKYIQRLKDLSTHEFGHTLGLPHCPNKGCVMEDAKGTVKTFDHSTGLLCEQCLDDLAKWGFTLPQG
jgi:archaemetzincin